MNVRGGVPMSVARKARLAGLVLGCVICISCGDVYRPTIIPNPVPTPDPKNFHSAFAVNQNTPFYPGTGMQVDVSGDSNAGVTKVAMGPVHAALLGSRVWVANSLSNSVSAFTGALGTSLPIGASIDINLPSGYSPVFVHSTEAATMYVANASSPDPNAAAGTVVVLSAGSNVVSEVIPVGINPVAMAETPNGQELYVVNQGSNNVDHIHTVDRSVAPIIPVGASPTLVYARNDNQRIYVLNQGSGTITTINTLDDSIVATSAAAGANYMVYDSHRNRLYLTSSTNSLYIYNAGLDPPTLLKQIPIPGAADCGQCVPISVAALPDGTRAYVASAFETTDPAKCVQPIGGPQVDCYLTQVTVVDAVNLTVKTSSAAAPNPIPVPTPKASVLPGVPVFAEANCAAVRFRLSTAASVDSSRVYLAACDAGGISSINTSSDTYVVTMPAPVSAFPPIQTDPNIPAQPPRQNPVFLLTGQ
jgi:YVTN family beta-propeller protein